MTNSHLNYHLLTYSFFQHINQFENRRLPIKMIGK
jgi:hypothetical protein